MNHTTKADILIVGAGFTGLTAAHELCKAGYAVTVLEADSSIGGLAQAFEVNGEPLDCFYHHWFNNDSEALDLIDELGLAGQLILQPTNTGLYYGNHIHRLATPWDLLAFTPLSFINRIRLGMLALKARKISDWKSLESISACEWLIEHVGTQVYNIVWKPLLEGKFGQYAENISAVWFWNKLKLRGGSRGKSGEEQLAYLKGSFMALADALAAEITRLGGRIILNENVKTVEPDGPNWRVVTDKSEYTGQQVILTPALPIIADMLQNWAEPAYLAQLNRIHYIGNICLVLEMDRPLSGTYWLNVNDSSYPFMGIIEHTNLVPAHIYGGHHIAYLSKYLDITDPLFNMSDSEYFDHVMPFLSNIFPDFRCEHVKKFTLWRARWSQPIVEKEYSELIPSVQSSKPGLFISSMAQIYPEDRGTNYAIREGKKISEMIKSTRKEKAS